MFRRKSTLPQNNAALQLPRITSVVADGVSLRGKLSGEGGVRIEGAFDGDIELGGLLAADELPDDGPVVAAHQVDVKVFAPVGDERDAVAAGGDRRAGIVEGVLLPVVGEPDRRHAELPGALEERIDLDRAVEERVLAVQVEVDEGARHRRYSHSIVAGGFDETS